MLLSSDTGWIHSSSCCKYQWVWMPMSTAWDSLGLLVVFEKKCPVVLRYQQQSGEGRNCGVSSWCGFQEITVWFQDVCLAISYFKVYMGKLKESPQVPSRAKYFWFSTFCLENFVLMHGVCVWGGQVHYFTFHLTLEKISKSNISSWILLTVTNIHRVFYKFTQIFSHL